MDKYILDNTITIQLPKEIEKNSAIECVKDAIEKLKTSIENKKKEELLITKREELLAAKKREFEDLKISDILMDLKNANKEYILDIVEYSSHYKSNIYVKLIIQYYCIYYDIKLFDYESIFSAANSRIIFGMIINIPIFILEKLYGNDFIPEDINTKEELAYYKLHNSIRIDNICKFVDGSYTRFIQDYLLQNHFDLLKAQNSELLKIFKSGDDMKYIYTMRDSLKNYS